MKKRIFMKDNIKNLLVQMFCVLNVEQDFLSNNLKLQKHIRGSKHQKILYCLQVVL